jgi:hypothetical protein
MSGLELRFNLQDPVVRAKQKAGRIQGRESRYIREAELLPPEQLDECRRDPAWEARNDVIDRVVCRDCGAQVKTPLHNRLSHLRSRHTGTSTRDYLTRYPGAPLSSIANMAKNHGKRERTVSEVLSERLNDYVTPEEREACHKEPDWEKRHGTDEFVICRHCGFKSRTELRDDRSGCHLNTHYMTKKEYLELYPGAPWRPEARAIVQRDLGRKWRDNQRARITELESRAKGGPAAKKVAIFAEAHRLHQLGTSWKQLAKQLTPNEYRLNGHNAAEALRKGAAAYRTKQK